MRIKEIMMRIPDLIRRSIQLKLTIQIFFVSLVPLIILGVVTSKISSTIIEQNVKINTIEIMDQVISNIDFYLKDMENISTDIYFNKSIIDNINKYKGVYDAEDIAAYNEIRRALINIISARSNIKTITIIPNKDYYFSSSYGNIPEMLFEQKWFIKANEINGSVFTAVDSKAYTIQNANSQTKGPDVVLLAKKMRDIYAGRTLGILRIDLNYRIIEEAVSKFNPDENGSVFMLDSDGIIIYKNAKNPMMNKMSEDLTIFDTQDDSGADVININREKIFRVYRTSGLSGWKLVELIPFNNLMGPARFVESLTILLILVCLAVALIISIFFSKRILKPLKYLGKIMNRVESGDLNVSVVMKSNDEIGILGNNFNNMVIQLREMQESIYREQEAKREAELSALQAQINPHFLYNTLDSIKWMAMVNGQNNIYGMITALVSLLRNSINKGKEIITIKQEINNVNNYIQIQRLRYYNSFDVVYNLDKTLMKYGIPKLILQPLVENALFHGLDNSDCGGKIHINIYRCDDDIVFEVIDNGRGMTKKELEGIYSNKTKHKFSGIGVKNVDSRLKLHYGGLYGLTYYSEPGKGTKVKGLMPMTVLHEEENADA